MIFDIKEVLECSLVALVIGVAIGALLVGKTKPVESEQEVERRNNLYPKPYNVDNKDEDDGGEPIWI